MRVSQGRAMRRGPFSVYMKGARLLSCSMGHNMITQAARNRPQFERYVTSKINKNSLKHQTKLKCSPLLHTLLSSQTNQKKPLPLPIALCTFLADLVFIWTMWFIYISAPNWKDDIIHLQSPHPMTCPLPDTSFLQTHLGPHSASCSACAIFYETQFKGRGLSTVAGKKMTS